MTDSRDQPELETLSYEPAAIIGSDASGANSEQPMGFNSVVLKPETRVNKAEDADQPKCKTCGDTGEVLDDFDECGGVAGAAVEVMHMRGELQVMKPCPDCQPDQPNQILMIITEIEGLMSQVNERLEKLDGGHYACVKAVKKGQALEEIDLFQKTTLFELRKAFE